MKKLFVIIFLLFGINNYLTAQSASQLCSEGKIQAFDHLSKIGKVNYPGDQTIDALYYKIDLTINKNFISGKTTVKLKPVAASIDSCFLDLKRNMIIDSVLLNNSKINFIRNSDEDKFTVSLPITFSPLEIFELDIYYHGNPIRSGFGGYIYTTNPDTANRTDGQPVIWTLSQPYGTSNWFPCKDSPGDKVDSSDVWITADVFYTTVSNGTLEEIIDNGSTKTYKWKNSTNA